MNKLTLALSLTLAAFGQTPVKPPKPAAPADLTIVVVDQSALTAAQRTALSNLPGVVILKLPATGVEVLNNFNYAQAPQAGPIPALKDLPITIVKNAIRSLATRDEFAPAALKAKLDAVKAAQTQLEAEVTAATQP